MKKSSLCNLILAGLLTTLPGTLPALAQQQFNVTTIHLYAGSRLPASLALENQPQYFDPNAAHPLVLTIQQDIYNNGGWLVIPAGSQVRGNLYPVQGGLKFVANELVKGGRTYPLQATSDLIHDEKDPRQYSSEAIVEDAIIGAAAGALLGGISGGVAAGEVIGGAATGVGVGNITAPQVVVLRPGQLINLTLDAPLRW
jgi:hypothetical protein